MGRGDVSFRCGLWQPPLESWRSRCTLGQAHGSQSHQKRAFRFCLTKLLWRADVNNSGVELHFKPSNDDDDGEKHLDGNADIWIRDCAARAVDSVSRRLVDNLPSLSSVRHARIKLSTLWSRDAGAYLREWSKSCLTRLENYVVFLIRAILLLKCCVFLWFSWNLCAHVRLTWITWMWLRYCLRLLRYCFWL